MDTSRILIGIISYLLGIGTGFVIKSFVGKEFDSKHSKTIVLLVVTTVWTISMLVEIANPSYHTNPMVHGLMGSIVGFFYKFEPKTK